MNKKSKATKRPAIPDKTIIHLWVIGGGRCYYCNKPLWRDDYAMLAMNRAYVAHIIDVNPQTHRYDPVLSPKLSKDISNLMLMCDEHHRMIDRELEAEFTVSILQELKRGHEQRIETLTGIKADRKSHVVLYGENTGDHASPVHISKSVVAMVPDNYPADPHPIELSLSGSAMKDNEPLFWKTQSENLSRQFRDKIKDRLESKTIKHMSVFAQGPQPLLIYLGHILGDLNECVVYQLHRNPAGWMWVDGQTVEYSITKPATTGKVVALNLSISGTIDNSRIYKCLGENTSIWTVSVKNPYNDIIRSKKDIEEFQKLFRQLLNEIKYHHKDSSELNIFPACPVSIAVEIGRCRMPKADFPFRLFDQNNKVGGFVETITIA